MRFNEALSGSHAGPYSMLLGSIRHSGTGFTAQLAQWSKVFKPLLESRRQPCISKTGRLRICVLKIIQSMRIVLFLMSFSITEIDFDKLTGTFREIVELAKELIVETELGLYMIRGSDPRLHFPSVAGCRHDG